MSEEIKIVSDSSTSEDGPVHEPKQNYVIYTIISVLLFALLYGSWQFISSRLSRDYEMTVNADSFTESQLDVLRNYTEINSESIDKITLSRVQNHISIRVYYENIGDAEKFISDAIKFEYGNEETDVRTEIYPYGNSVPEYVYANRYVNIENPSAECLVYEYNDSCYAEFHSTEVDSEISALFSGAEKVYDE